MPVIPFAYDPEPYRKRFAAARSHSTFAQARDWTPPARVMEVLGPVAFLVTGLVFMIFVGRAEVDGDLWIVPWVIGGVFAIMLIFMLVWAWRRSRKPVERRIAVVLEERLPPGDDDFVGVPSGRLHLGFADGDAVLPVKPEIQAAVKCNDLGVAFVKDGILLAFHPIDG